MPKNTHPISRLLLILLSLAIAVTFLVGTFRAFAPAHARAAAPPTPALLATPTPLVTDISPNDAPPPKPSSPVAGLKSADTTGILTQAVVVVVVIIFGAFWGWHVSAPPRPRQRKK